MGIVVPSGTPQPIVGKLTVTARRPASAPDTLARFDKDAVEPVGNTPAEFKALISLEIGQWRELAKQTKITVE
jgi:tripartite-type tricarboxylate transporter receptor subunit TctC